MFSYYLWRPQQESLARHMCMCRLRANRNDFAAFYLQNLLVFEPNLQTKFAKGIALRQHDKYKIHPAMAFIFMASPAGIEPASEV